MALIAGSAVAGTGLAGAITNIMANRIQGYNRQAGAPMIDALAEGIISYIKQEAVVTVAVGQDVRDNDFTFLGKTTTTGAGTIT